MAKISLDLVWTQQFWPVDPMKLLRYEEFIAEPITLKDMIYIMYD